MGFTVVETWTIRRRSPLHRLADAADQFWDEANRRWPVLEQSRRPIAFGLAAAIHVGGAIFLIQHFDVADLVEDAAKPMIVAFDVTGDAEPEDEAANRGAEATIAASADGRAPTPPETVVPEWSLSTVKVARNAMPSVEIRPNAASSGAAFGTVGDGAGTTGVYDPYAGASPDRRQEKLRPKRPVTIMSASDGLDGAKLDKLAERLRELLPTVRGSIALTLVTDRSGRVTSVDVVEASMLPQVVQRILAEVKGSQIAGHGGRLEGVRLKFG